MHYFNIDKIGLSGVPYVRTTNSNTVTVFVIDNTQNSIFHIIISKVMTRIADILAFIFEEM